MNIAERFLKKGSKLYIEGQLETRKWQDNSGADRYSTEVVLRPYRGEITLLDNKPETGTAYQAEESQMLDKSSTPESGPTFAVDDFDDEIPF